jgi:hypothetical protein
VCSKYLEVRSCVVFARPKDTKTFWKPKIRKPLFDTKDTKTFSDENPKDTKTFWTLRCGNLELIIYRFPRISRIQLQSIDSASAFISDGALTPYYEQYLLRYTPGGGGGP